MNVNTWNELVAEVRAMPNAQERDASMKLLYEIVARDAANAQKRKAKRK